MVILDTEDILKTVKNSLENKKPLSIVRCGDGEAIVLNGFKDLPSLKAVYKRQFGFIPPIDHSEEIRENLISAYKNCDIIGIPLKESKNEDYWSKVKDILKENTHENILEEKFTASIDLHSHLLDKDHYTKLLEGLDTLNYISCRNLDAEFKNLFNIRTVNRFTIAPEVKFTSGYNGEKHYPYQFNQIRKWMDRAINCEGSLCLTGAGVVGKIYNNWFRDRGGVAIDIGSIFDSWAGLSTRGSERGLDVKDDKYKL